MPYWIEQFNDPAAHGKISLIVSILSVGTFVGALAAGLIADITGRKWGIIICAAIPFNLGVILQVAATEQSMFIAGRFFAGLGVGLVSVQIPMYQAETLPKWIRGFIIGSYQLCITIGLLLASLINYGKFGLSAFSLSASNTVQPPRTAMTLAHTVSLWPFSSPGLSFCALECACFPRLLVS
jgi:SP family sugar:H+ symporter-like MFS transporter